MNHKILVEVFSSTERDAEEKMQYVEVTTADITKIAVDKAREQDGHKFTTSGRVFIAERMI